MPSSVPHKIFALFVALVAGGIFLLGMQVQYGKDQLTQKVLEADVYLFCTDLPEFTVPGTGINVHTPKDGETMNAACRDMDGEFFRIMEKSAEGWVRAGDSLEKKVLAFMRWLDLDLPHDLAYRIGGTAVIPNLATITIVRASQADAEKN